MKSWSVNTRFLLSVFVFSLPLVAMIYYLYISATEMVDFSAKEYQGVKRMNDAYSFQSKIVKMHFSAILEKRDILEAEKDELRQEWKNVIGSIESTTLNKEKAIRALEKYLNSEVEEKRIGGRFLQFNQEQINVQQDIADNYNIVLDPDLDSFYLMDSVVSVLPRVVEFYFQAAQIVGGTDDVMYEFQKERLKKIMDSYEELVKRALSNLEKSYVNDAGAFGESESFQKNYESYSLSVREQIREVYGLVMHTDRTLQNPQASLQSLADLANRSIMLTVELNREFEAMVGARLEVLRAQRDNRLMMSIGALALAVLISVILGGTITKTFQVFKSVVLNLRQEADSAMKVGEALMDASSRVSDASNKQAAAIEETSASLEELGSMVTMTAANTEKAREVVRATKNQAQQGEVEMKALSKSMHEISDSSKKISEIMVLIDDVAFQTNLLALNASVEAARAGEHGRGFAVVADAVRALAQKSAESAKSISELIRTSVEKIEQGYEVASRSESTMRSILIAIENVDTLSAEIAVASQEQAAGIQQISKAVNELEKGTVENTGVAQQSQEYSKQSLQQAEALLGIISSLENELKGASRSG